MAHKKCRKFIKELEKAGNGHLPVNRPSVSPIAQAPSTQRLLDAHPVNLPNAMLPNIPAKIDKETGRAMVPSGNGTQGPRKF
jgi:hypothetical protein